MFHSLMEMAFRLKHTRPNMPVDAIIQAVIAQVASDLGDNYDDECPFRPVQAFRSAAPTLLRVFNVVGVGNTPLLEYRVTQPINEQLTLIGYIDAVLFHHPTDRVVLVDWKLRRKPLPTKYIQIDRQLYLYAWAIQKLGINVDVALQIEVSENSSKIEYRPVKLDNRLIDNAIETFEMIGNRIINEETPIPAMSTYICKSCDYRKRCQEVLEGHSIENVLENL